MAFSGVHLFCAEAGGDNGGFDNYNVQTYRNPLWSESLSGSSGLSGNTAPAGRKSILRIEAAVDIWGAIGKKPDATQTTSGDGNSARFRVTAGTPFDIYLAPGDKFAFSNIP